MCSYLLLLLLLLLAVIVYRYFGFDPVIVPVSVLLVLPLLYCLHNTWSIACLLSMILPLDLDLFACELFNKLAFQLGLLLLTCCDRWNAGYMLEMFKTSWSVLILSLFLSFLYALAGRLFQFLCWSISDQSIRYLSVYFHPTVFYFFLVCLIIFSVKLIQTKFHSEVSLTWTNMWESTQR